MPSVDILARKDIVIVFLYAPAGLGHLRVTDALYEGLPSAVRPILLGSRNQSIKSVHRMISLHTSLRALMEWLQQGTPQAVFTRFYRHQLSRSNKQFFRELVKVIHQQIEEPSVLLLVATHYGLAHQIDAIKALLEKETKASILLVVQVTDDSPQYIWFVPGADMIVVPSHTTKEVLSAYARHSGLKKTKFEVVPYPVSPLLAAHNPRVDEVRKKQLDPQKDTPIHVTIPISGAAVGLHYFSRVITLLKRKSRRFRFHIVARESPHTMFFLHKMKQRHRVKVYSSTKDKEVVDLYQMVYQQHIISLEITKPSEQAFKAHYSTKQTGGSILLFAKPVGRQEYDNLHYLERHALVPTGETQKHLYEAFRGLPVVSADLYQEADHWRGLTIPDDPNDAADYIWWLFQSGILLRMANHRLKKPDPAEVSSNGVKIFWEKVAKMVEAEVS